MQKCSIIGSLQYKPKGLLTEIFRFLSHVPQVSALERTVYMQLSEFTFGKAFTFIGQEKVAELCTCSVRSVQRAVQRLETLNLLRVVKEGKLTKYYFVVPAELETLARKYGVLETERSLRLGKQTDKESGDNGTNRGDKLSCVVQKKAEESDILTSQSDILSTRHDILSPTPVFKNINTPPLPPAKIFIDGRRGRKKSLGSSPSVSVDSLKQAFARLLEAYPCKKHSPEAFRVFCREYSSLPLLDVLIQCIEYEKTHNVRWQRGYPKYLKNWLYVRDFEAILPLLQVQASAKPASAFQSYAAAQVPSYSLQKEKAQNVPSQLEKLHVMHAFNEQEFNNCSGLWSVKDSIQYSLFKAYWCKLLADGIAPLFAEAQKVRDKFSNLFDWLRSLKSAELVGA